jgi:hypothetical protein
VARLDGGAQNCEIACASIIGSIASPASAGAECPAAGHLREGWESRCE